MPELEEKLSALLSDPNGMAQVMQLAQQLSTSLGGTSPSGTTPDSSVPPAPKKETTTDAGAMGDLDPQLLQRILPLLGELHGSNSSTMRLLMALKPFLKEEKQDKLQRAAKLARLIHVGKKFLSEWGG